MSNGQIHPSSKATHGVAPRRVVAGTIGSAGSPRDGFDSARNKMVFLLSVMRRWGAICFPIGMVLAIAATVAMRYLCQPTYQAVVWLRIEDKRPMLVSMAKAQTDSKRFEEDQVQLICSPLVVGQALKEPTVADLPDIKRADSPVDWLTERLKVIPTASDYYKVQFTGPTPVIAATVANTVVSAYMDINTQGDTKESQILLELLEQEKERRKKELERLQENVSVLVKQVGARDPTLAQPRGVVVMGPRSLDEDKLANVEIDRQMAETKLKSLEVALSQKRVDVSAAQVDIAINSRDEVRQLQKTIDQTKMRIEKTIQISAKGSDDPRVREQQSELTKLETSLKQLQEKLRAEVTAQVQTVELAKREMVMADLRALVAEKQSQEDLFRRRVEARAKERETVSGQSAELDNSRAAQARAETVYQAICDRALALQTEMRAPTRVTLVDRASAPAKPVQDFFAAKLIAAILAALFAPFASVLLVEEFRCLVMESKELEDAIGVPVIGEIAALPSRPRFRKGSTEQFKRNQELYEESIDALRTSLVISDEMHDVKVLAVASAVSSEGKTSLASQLAVSLARASGEQTLLIDGDMRAPDVHMVFEIGNEKGLADVLDGRCTAQEAIVTNWHEHLHLLPAGQLKRSPYVLLSSGRFESILAELRNVYRYIVIDAPPVLSASEALIIAKAADGAILCTLRERTRAPQVTLARQRLEAAGVRILGAVLAGVPARSYAYKYGGYYYYGNRGSERNGNGMPPDANGKSIHKNEDAQDATA